MEDTKLEYTENTDSKKIGIQVVLMLNLGFSIEEHKLIPELLTPEEYDEKVETFLNYGDYEKMELECIDAYGSTYSLIVNNNLLAGSYFKFQRVNVQAVS